MINILGICGRAQSGKTTLANALAGGAVHLAFADRLKQEVATELLAGHKAAQNLLILGEGGIAWAKELLRPALIFWGEYRRWEQPDYWLAPVINEFLSRPGNNYVVSDVRYVNEARALRALGARIIRLTRAGEVPDIRTETSSLAEIEAAGLIDAWIDNNGTVAELVARVGEVTGRGR